MWRAFATLAVLLTALCAVNSRPQETEKKDVEPVPKEREIQQMTLSERLEVEKELIDMYCEPYLAGLERGRPRCGKDLSPHCLVNGSVILGSCRLKRAVCVERVLEDFDWFSCADYLPVEFSRVSHSIQQK